MRIVKTLPALIVVFCIGSLIGNVACAESPNGSFQPFKTGVLKGGDEAQQLDVDVTGVADLYLVVTYGPDNYRSDQAIWGEPRLTAADGSTIDLTTLTPARAQVGWGKLLVDKNHQDHALTVGSRTFSKGFWAHGPSLLQFKLDGRYTRFSAQVGIDVAAGKAGSAEFLVTNVPVEMPSRAVYTKPIGPSQPTVSAPSPAATATHQFNKQAAARLIEQGIDRLLFVRRHTFNANHVYTEYVNSRWLPGGGLCILDLKTGKAQDLLPELSVGVVNRFDLSYDGSKIVFDYKKGPLEGYRIYEVNVDGSGLRQLTFPPADEQEMVKRFGRGSYHHGTDDLHPCYLPDGGIVFASTRAQYGILCDASDTFTTKNLFRMDADGGNMKQLSNSPVSEATPAILPDGRILYHRWEYVDKAAGNVKCLWAMNPDGTATAEVYGNMISFPETMIYPRPIPGTDSKIVMLGTSHWRNNAKGAVIVVDTSADIRSPETMKFITDDVHALAHDGFHFRDADGQWRYDKTGTQGRLFKDPYPLSEELFIVSRKPKGPAWDDLKAYDLCLLDADGTDTLLYADDTTSCWHPYPLLPRKRPPVIQPSIDKELANRGMARCVVTDIYEGMGSVKRGAVKYLRILEEVPRPWDVRKDWYKDDRDGMAHTAIGDGALGLKVQHGIVPVEEDGSAHFDVPAERNIYLQALDENFLAIQTERTYVHYMPGETRSCIGCHETPNRIQPREGGIPLALQREPSMPQPQPGDAKAAKLFDYDRQIQPILNRHCVRCHSGDEPKAKLTLTGEPQGVYSVSYNNLIKRGQSAKQLLGNRKLRDENVASADVNYIPPYSLGALSSPMAAMLSRGKIVLRDARLQSYADILASKHDLEVRLSDADFLTLTNWLDINCQFHRSYWGRLNEKFREHPNYRPAVTFAEALSRTVPKSVSAAEQAASGE